MTTRLSPGLARGNWTRIESYLRDEGRPGTPAQCVEHLRELLDEGPKSVTLRITSWRQAEQFDRLVDDVLPRLAEGPAPPP
jgi:alkanesulfonate monooxygenase SsuD/methylene tetrahydromethanopterin reductase-like flavin-dependent oxidoreductase (luciferase family)